jgi:hypothetical protein
MKLGLLVMGLALAVSCLPLTAWAQEKPNATGTWLVKFMTPDGNTIEYTLKLKQDGEKLAGVAIREDRESPIDKGTIKANEVSFQTTREVGGQKIVATYKGKLAGDTIKGTITAKVGDQDFTIDWEAKRDKK